MKTKRPGSRRVAKKRIKKITIRSVPEEFAGFYDCFAHRSMLDGTLRSELFSTHYDALLAAKSNNEPLQVVRVRVVPYAVCK